MRVRQNIYFLLLFLLTPMIMRAAVQKTAANNYSLSLSSGNVLWLEGDSTLHPYASTSTSLTIYSKVSGEENSIVLKSLSFSMPVESLQSGKKGLDKKLYKTINIEKNPLITFRSSGTAASQKNRQNGTSFISVQGFLKVASKEIPVTLTAQIIQKENLITVQGTQPLRMTDFDMKPPQMFLGAIKTKDEVTIHYKLNFTIMNVK